VSMGGMIAQILAARHPQRVATLTSIMSSSGSRRVPGPRLDLRLRLVRRPARLDRESLIRHSMETWRLIGSPDYLPDEQALYEKCALSFERGHYPPGLARQTLAILASGSRGPLLKKITAPTLIVHGAEDPLVPVAAAHDLARRLPHARLHIIPRMGHDLPAALLPRLAALILEQVRGAPAAAAA
jgi:pimeloyl-ACP methyl ester carboxylesterase